MVLCAWYDADLHKCSHSANLTGICRTTNPGFDFQQCDSIHTINPPKTKIPINEKCNECGQWFAKEVWSSRKKIYIDAVKRSILVCCNCYSKRQREITGTWTEPEFAFLWRILHRNYQAMREIALKKRN